jgi:hypothetical protein
MAREWKLATISAESFASTVAGGLAAGIINGDKLSLILQKLTLQLAQMVLKATLFNIIMSGVTGIAGTSGGGGVATRAGGGSVQTNQPFLVGEKGPELFVPGANGTIVPNDKLSRTGGTVINIDARGAAPGVEAQIQRAMAVAEDRAVSRSVQFLTSERSRGGAF